MHWFLYDIDLRHERVEEKANYSNEFFSLQCSPVVNSLVLPDKSYLTTSSLESITISGSNILKTIRSLDKNKAYDHDDISIECSKFAMMQLLSL